MDIVLILMLLTSTAEPQYNTSHYNSILDIMLSCHGTNCDLSAKDYKANEHYPKVWKKQDT